MENKTESRRIPWFTIQKIKSSVENNRKDQVENGKVEKKLKLESETDPEKQVFVDKPSFDNLPPEMLMEILKNLTFDHPFPFTLRTMGAFFVSKRLNIKTLRACRLANRKWCWIASQILKSREDVEIRIDCSKESGNLLCKDGKAKRLSNFMKCFDPSNNFPYSRFWCQVDNSTFDNKDWLKFLSDFGENIKCLKLEIKYISKDNHLRKLTKKLRYLLLTQLPNLEEFGLYLDYHVAPNSSKIQLFPATRTNKNLNATKVVQLPHLKSLYLNQYTLSRHTRIATDILRAAVNLEKLSMAAEPSLKNFYILQSLGKLGCLQHQELELCPDVFDNQLKYQTQSAPLDFKLKELDLYFFGLYEDESSSSALSSFLTNLFETSKDTLTDLYVDALGFLHELQLPRFSRLFSLRIIGIPGEFNILEPIIPPGIKLQDTFPVLNSLELGIPWTTAFPRQDCIAPLPTLEELKPSLRQIRHLWLSSTDRSLFRLFCPNFYGRFR